MAAEEAPTPLRRTIIVDVTVAVEVTVTYDPMIADRVQVEDVTPDWNKLDIGFAYWQPSERQTNIGIRADVKNHLNRELPKRLALRYHHPD